MAETRSAHPVTGRTWGFALLACLVAGVLSTLAALGAVGAVLLSGPTVIYGATETTVLEWAPPLAVYQWCIAGVVELALIAAATAAWWGAGTLWVRRRPSVAERLSPHPFVLAGGAAMIATSVLALTVHVHNWRQWRTLVVEHPNWGESVQSWQIPLGAVVVGVIVAAVAFAMVRLSRVGRATG